ncbi:MAG: LacI family DNA-binding transcriptional regulator [Capsulimonadaceae bacterium]|nr:LacI family DNA-binding transcriptional regulator [Capsulimonadaceae bacterium]
MVHAYNVFVGTSTTLQPRVTLKDVAIHANVSQATASTVLSGLDNGIRVTPSTIERVRESARILGYRSRTRERNDRLAAAHTGAHAHSDSMSSTTKLFAPGIITKVYGGSAGLGAHLEPWHNEVAAAFEIVASAIPGTATRYFNRARTGQPTIPVEFAIESLIADGANALMLIDFDWVDVVEEFIPAFQASGVPFVFVSAGPLAAPVANVCYDNRGAGFQAAAHLIQQGHREIAFIATGKVDWIESRISGARTAMRQHGLPPESLRVYPADRPLIAPSKSWTHNLSHLDASREIARQGFREGVIPAAVIAANDEMALGVIDAARELGKCVPRDLAIIGFDDIPQAKEAGLSTLRAPREEMGREAARMLFKIFQGNRLSNQICFRSDLITRASTSPINANWEIPTNEQNC